MLLEKNQEIAQLQMKYQKAKKLSNQLSSENNRLGGLTTESDFLAQRKSEEAELLKDRIHLMEDKHHKQITDM